MINLKLNCLFCAFEGCENVATEVVKGRTGHPDIGAYCEAHAQEVEVEENPEYVVDCPNCGCRFGVN